MGSGSDKYPMCRVGGEAASDPATDRASAPGRTTLVEQTGEALCRAPNTGAGGLVAARDAHLRITQYVRPAEEFSRRVMDEMTNPETSAKFDHIEGRARASTRRSDLRTDLRGKLSPAGRGMSEAVEAKGPTIGELANKYAMKELANNPELRARFGITVLERGDQATKRALAVVRESPEVSAAIIRAAGSPNKTVTGAARVIRVLGPMMVGAQAVTSTYRVLSAEEGDRLWTTGREISGFAGGTIGSSAGGVVVATLGAIAVGAGVAISAPVAIGVSFLVIGGMAVAGSTAAQSVWDQRVSPEALDAFMLDLGHAVGSFLSSIPLHAALPAHSMATGGGWSGVMERDRRRIFGK